jgi:winged helix DNA-binding protein
VRHLLAVQSQDYAGAKWALGQRIASTTDAELDRQFDAGAILRTHVMRPTWHFVDPADLRWLLALTAPRVHQANAYQYKLLELDPTTRARGRAVIESALRDGGALTREELGRALNEAGLQASGLRLGYLTADAELEGLICSGPRRGRRQTYALLEERVPPAPPRERDEALAEIARRYVEGHGPAQVADLAWWSGLTVADSRRALDLATPPLERLTVGQRTFWFAAGVAPEAPVEFERPAVHLLPNYDELLIAFRDRSDATDPALPPPARVAQVILAHVMVRDGLVVGGWRRVEEGGGVRVSTHLLVSLEDRERRAFQASVGRLAAFLERPVEVSGLD